MREHRCMICRACQQAGCRMVQLHVVLSIPAVLAVHKLLSCLPYCSTPSVAQTSCSVPLVSLLYTSKQSAERITTWRELEIIAGQTSTASLCFVWWYLRLNPPCCWGRDRKEASRGGKDAFFTDQICACYWILIPELNKHPYSGRGQFSDRDSENKHSIEKERLDKGDDNNNKKNMPERRLLKETKAEVISFSTSTLPCWCNCCAGVSWDPNHTALWEPLSFSITPSQSKTF